MSAILFCLLSMGSAALAADHLVNDEVAHGQTVSADTAKSHMVWPFSAQQDGMIRQVIRETYGEALPAEHAKMSEHFIVAAPVDDPLTLLVKKVQEVQVEVTSAAIRATSLDPAAVQLSVRQAGVVLDAPGEFGEKLQLFLYRGGPRAKWTMYKQGWLTAETSAGSRGDKNIFFHLAIPVNFWGTK